MFTCAARFSALVVSIITAAAFGLAAPARAASTSGATAGQVNECHLDGDWTVCNVGQIAEIDIRTASGRHVHIYNLKVVMTITYADGSVQVDVWDSHYNWHATFEDLLLLYHNRFDHVVTFSSGVTCTSLETTQIVGSTVIFADRQFSCDFPA